jgi:predicted nucleic acid-binding protein
VSGFLLDTSVIVELINPRPAPALLRWLNGIPEELLFLSVLTLGDIRRGTANLGWAARAVRVQAWTNRDLKTRFAGRILPIDGEVAACWGVLAARSMEDGARLPVVDGLLAATALDHNLTLVTRNAGDVARTGVLLFSPWEV